VKAQGPDELALAEALAELANDRIKVPCAEDLATDLWFAETPAERAEAATWCDGCAVFTECAAASVEVRPRFGVWAGRDWTPRPRRNNPTEERESL
jgi:hypothetical protein